MADSGVAMPGGGFPIRNRSDLERAVHALGRASNPDAVKRHIAKRARALGAEAWLREHTSWFKG